MKDKHTPGPWKTDDEFIYDDSGRSIAYVETYHSGKLPYQANARLIAAAPEMLEILKESVWYIDFGDSGAIEWHEQMEKLIAKIERD